MALAIDEHREQKILSISPDCPGSWRPVPRSMPGETVRCDECGRQFPATRPPPRDWTDPWRGALEARVAPHWARLEE